MKTFSKLFISDLKLNLRNRQAMFWRFVFPLIFIVIFGLFNLDSAPESHLAIIDSADTEQSRAITDGFKKINSFRIETQTDLEAAKEELRAGNLDLIVILPETIKSLVVPAEPPVNFEAKTDLEKMPTIIPDPVMIEVFYNEANVSQNQLALNVLNQITTELNLKVSNVPKLFELKTEPLTNRTIRYIDFLTPGIIAMALMSSGIIGIAVYLTEYREKKILKRLLATPLNRRAFVASQILSRLVLSLVEALIIILAAKLFYHVNVYGSYFWIAVWVILGTTVFLNIGFILASFAKTVTAAESMSQIVTIPMMFLSGVFFSSETLPNWVAKLVAYLPLTPVIEALRKISLNGESITATYDQLLLIGIWLVVSFAIASWRFRLTRQ